MQLIGETVCHKIYGVGTVIEQSSTGNQGYLFELNKELARIFLRETVKRNPLIGDIDYVQELLTEGDDAT